MRDESSFCRANEQRFCRTKRRACCRKTLPSCLQAWFGSHRTCVDEYQAQRSYCSYYMAHSTLQESLAQSTVEYALTVAAVLAIMVGCAAVWRAGVDGAFAKLVEAAISHAISAAGAIDIALY